MLPQQLPCTMSHNLLSCVRLWPDVLQMLEEQRKQEEEAVSELLPLRARRHLLDTFADSLRHTNKRFNAVYGHASRKVPAHMPHMLNKDIAQEMHDK